MLFPSQPMRGNAAVIAAWRQDHPNGLSNRELQAASSSSLAASAFQLYYPSSVFASAPADPSWRHSHPNGMTERELQAASSSSLAMWQLPRGAGIGNAQTNIAQASTKATSLSKHPSTEPSSWRSAAPLMNEWADYLASVRDPASAPSNRTPKTSRRVPGDRSSTVSTR